MRVRQWSSEWKGRTTRDSFLSFTRRRRPELTEAPDSRPRSTPIPGVTTGNDAPLGAATVASSGPTIGPDGKLVFNDGDRKKRGCVKYVIAAFVALALLIGGCTVVLLKATAKPAKEAQAFVKEIMANDPKAAYARTSSGFREASTEADLAEISGRISSIVGGAKLTNTGRAINAKTGTASTAQINYKTSKDGRTLYFTVNMVKQGEDWKVLNFDSSETPPSDNSDTTDVSGDNVTEAATTLG